jgi:hypothetical protein
MNKVQKRESLLNAACGLIDDLEQLHIIINEREYRESELARRVNRFFELMKELEHTKNT